MALVPGMARNSYRSLSATPTLKSHSSHGLFARFRGTDAFATLDDLLACALPRNFLMVSLRLLFQ